MKRTLLAVFGRWTATSGEDYVQMSERVTRIRTAFFVTLGLMLALLLLAYISGDPTPYDWNDKFDDWIG